MAARVHELTGQRRPFVHATVVRAQAPTSAVPGDDAVILADGSIEGFVGGVCAETSVRAAALDTLRDGNTVLLRVLPNESEQFPSVPGAQVVVNPCLSGGAIEIFLRPMLPRPLIGIAGETTPIGAAVVTLAGFLDLEITKPMSYAGASAVVVAGLGRGDEQAIRAALDAGVPLVALVASRTRSAAVLDSLGLSPAERARVRPHAGIDIGARTHKEIALSVLAEIIRDLRATEDAPHAPLHLTDISEMSGGRTAIDPICGMTVVIGEDTPHAVVDGVEHWFCCAGCRDRFVAA
ncbi:XdhC family protein [Paractinoplanes globisporus]|uniref:XdhC family protein n=1 Tax=Paractinoplanes globisporus TaxID=113565 RepID=A0ABW6W5W6_9ACTN|nr:XdhC family protein [Actinoplanes globisporus]